MSRRSRNWKKALCGMCVSALMLHPVWALAGAPEAAEPLPLVWEEEQDLSLEGMERTVPVKEPEAGESIPESDDVQEGGNQNETPKKESDEGKTIPELDDTQKGGKQKALPENEETAKIVESGLPELAVQDTAAEHAAKTGLQEHMQVQATAGESYDIAVSGTALVFAADTEFRLTFQSSEWEVEDLCALTYEPELQEGAVAGTAVTVVSLTEESLTFTVDREIPEGTTWSGVLNVIRLKALVDGELPVLASCVAETHGPVAESSPEELPEVEADELPAEDKGIQPGHPPQGESQPEEESEMKKPETPAAEPEGHEAGTQEPEEAAILDRKPEEEAEAGEADRKEADKMNQDTHKGKQEEIQE